MMKTPGAKIQPAPNSEPSIGHNFHARGMVDPRKPGYRRIVQPKESP